MRGLRLSLASWQMLQRLAENTAALWYSNADGRFYFTLHDRTVELVRPSTMDALAGTGLIRRERSTVPWYSISGKGRTVLQKRIETGELLQ